ASPRDMQGDAAGRYRTPKAHGMTWSIIARDKATGAFGIAVATKFFAVGARVPFIAAVVAGVATQALINPFYGSKGPQLLRGGMSAESIVNTPVADDAGRDHRQ